MEIKKRSRTELKSFFVKNAIPTEGEFADLIDGTLNQKDDGIVKLPGSPLSIEASGDAASQKKTLNFYTQFSDPNPAWVLSLNPRSDPANPATAKPGFSISDAAGNSRLFIDESSGNVGIGTVEPIQNLDVNGRIHVNNGVIQRGGPKITATNDLGLYSQVPGHWIRIVSNAAPIRFFTDNGVGTAIKLSIEPDGVVSIPGTLDFGTQARQMINFWGTAHGIGIQDSTTYFRTDTNFAWFKGGSHSNAALNAGGGAVQMVIKDGNLGIGTASPGAKLDILANTATAGGWYEALRFSQGAHSAITHPGGGLLFGLHGNRNFYFADIKGGTFRKYVMMINAESGNVGIGTTDPKVGLTVNGHMIRKVYASSGVGPNSEVDNGVIPGRALSFTKHYGNTAIRVVYADNFRVAGAGIASRWEVLIDGRRAPGGGIYSDKYHSVNTNQHDPNIIIGYAIGLAAGNHAVTVRVGPSPGYPVNNAYTGWNNSRWTIEVEEVWL